MFRRQLAIIIGLLVAASSNAASLAANVEQGKRLALTYCAKCHAIDKVSESQLTIAPAFARASAIFLLVSFTNCRYSVDLPGVAFTQTTVK